MEMQPEKMRAYYRFHAGIYDATRWSFLFGRKTLLYNLPVRTDIPQSLLEAGCGTGHNLRLLARRYPALQLTGVDVSADMLHKAAETTAPFAERVQLINGAYEKDAARKAPDHILFSYALTMFNPGWEQAIQTAWNDLPSGGHIGVVDFHDTPSRAFQWWMGQNHVALEGHLLPFLQSTFRTLRLDICPAWLGLWRYFMFVGVKT
jgi:S-adenosylmethionine-diacylgycerolhomoserine-N-methlytransferase